MKLVYLAHPLSGDWDANIADARLWVRVAIDNGYCPVAPYLMTEGILHEPEDRELGLQLDSAFIDGCHEFWLCGPRVSPGMALEQGYAEACGLPVRQFSERHEVTPA